MHLGLVGFPSVLVAFLGVAVCPGISDAQTQKIRIAYSSRSNTITPLYVAANNGFFRDEGLEVELIQVSPRLGAMAVMNGDVSFTTSFVSTFRGILQGLPLKVILIALKKGMYFLVVRPEIKDVNDLKGKKLGVATIRGTDQLVAAELLRSKGFDPALVQQLVIGETPLRAQALASGAVQAVSVSPPYDLMLQQMGYKILAGPPEVGMPASGFVYLGSFVEGQSSDGKADIVGGDESQSFYRCKSPGNYRCDVKVVAADRGCRGSVL
jgi:ABC-type nitrate/sulfonate/bicarbonate transport system substrate-binding protein